MSSILCGMQGLDDERAEPAHAGGRSAGQPLGVRVALVAITLGLLAWIVWLQAH